jgi:hypothetical protein
MSIYKYFDGHLTVILQVMDGIFMDDYSHFNELTWNPSSLKNCFLFH